MRRITAAVLGTAILVGGAALVALNAKAQEPIGTDVNINGNRNLTSIQMAHGIAYQCVRDYNQCLKTIPNSTLWSSAAYEFEMGSCCIGIAYCSIFADSVRGGSGVAHLTDYVELACPTEDESSAMPTPEVRRSAKMDALLAQPETVD